MAISSVGATSAQSAFGLDFQSLLKIILTQLTYQDPLKPVDNAEFVSQLAQFASLQQSQTLNDQVTSLLASQSAAQATSLLGRTVDFTSETQTITGTVKAISFSSGQPEVSVQTPSGQTIANLSIAQITSVR